MTDSDGATEVDTPPTPSAWTDHRLFDAALVTACGLGVGFGIVRAFEGESGIAVVLLLVGAAVGVPLWMRREFKNDSLSAAAGKAGVAAVLAVVTAVVVVAATPDDPPPTFRPEVDGVAVDGSSAAAEPSIGDWIAGSIDEIDSFGECGIIANDIEVWAPATTAAAIEANGAAGSKIDLVIEVDVSRTSRPSVFDVAMRLDPIALGLRSTGDPYVLGELRATAADIDVGRDLDGNAARFFAELPALPALIAGLREFDDGSSAAADRARCAFGAAEELLGSGDRRAQELRASLQVLVAATHIRDANELDRRDQSLADASSALDDAEIALKESDVPGFEPDETALAVVEANRLGVRYLELFDADGTLLDGLDVEGVEAMAADFAATAPAADIAPVGHVLARTLVAKLWLAAAVESTVRDGFAMTGDREVFLRRADEESRAVASSTAADDPAAGWHVADAHYTTGQVAAERLDFAMAADAYGRAAASVTGSLAQRYVLFQAVAFQAACELDAAETLFEEVAAYLQDNDDEEILELYETASSIGSRCAERGDS